MTEEEFARLTLAPGTDIEDFNPNAFLPFNYVPPIRTQNIPIATAQNPAMVNYGIMGTDQANMFTGDYDDEYVPMPEEKEDKQSGLQTLLSYLPFGSNSIGGRILGGIRNFFDFKNSPMYRPATTSAFGYTPAQLNQMNALGGFYSEPMREVRRRSNRISNMLQRAAANKKFSQKNLSNLMNQFNMGDVDTRGMIDSIRQSADMGYGRGGGRDFDSGRDYSSSPGAIAGDMEYGEE